MSAKLLDADELYAELAHRFLTESPYELLALVRTRSGGDLPTTDQILHGIAAFASAQQARGVKTIRDVKMRSRWPGT